MAAETITKRNLHASTPGTVSGPNYRVKPKSIMWIMSKMSGALQMMPEQHPTLPSRLFMIQILWTCRTFTKRPELLKLISAISLQPYGEENE